MWAEYGLDQGDDNVDVDTAMDAVKASGLKVMRIFGFADYNGIFCVVHTARFISLNMKIEL